MYSGLRCCDLLLTIVVLADLHTMTPILTSILNKLHHMILFALHDMVPGARLYVMQDLLNRDGWVQLCTFIAYMHGLHS